MNAIKRTCGVSAAAALLAVSSVGMAAAETFDPDEAIDHDELEVEVSEVDPDPAEAEIDATTSHLDAGIVHHVPGEDYTLTVDGEVHTLGDWPALVPMVQATTPAGDTGDAEDFCLDLLAPEDCQALEQATGIDGGLIDEDGEFTTFDDDVTVAEDAMVGEWELVFELRTYDGSGSSAGIGDVVASTTMTAVVWATGIVLDGDENLEPEEAGDYTVTVTNGTEDDNAAELGDGWSLGLTVAGIDSTGDVTIEWQNPEGDYVEIPDWQLDLDGNLLYVTGLPEDDAIAGGDSTTQQFRATFHTEGQFLGTAYVFEAGVVDPPEPAPDTYDLSVDSTDGGEVTDPGEGTFTYEEDTDVELVAEADDGYEFDGWDGDVGNIDDPDAAETSITMTNDASITATFEQEEEYPPPGPFTAYVEAGDLAIGDEAFEMPQCPDGEPAEMGGECIEITGELDADGNFTAAGDDISFPLLEDEVDTPLGMQDLIVAITAPDGATGTMGDDGEVTFETELDINIQIGSLTDDTCHIPAVDLGLTTGDSGALDGSPLVDGRATIVDGEFIVDGATGCGTILFVIQLDDLINNELGLPSHVPGDNTVEFDLLVEFDA